MKKAANWYFDIISPYAYLQAKQLAALGERLEIQAVPVLFAGLLNHWGQLGPAEIEPKRRFIFRQCAWRAERLGVPFTMPPAHPFNPLWGLRLVAAQGNSDAAVQAVFDHLWADGRGLLSAEDRAALAARVGLSLEQAEAAVADPAVKQTLIDNTRTANEQQVFGVPTFVVEGQLFWGDDATAMLVDWLDGALDLDTELTRRIDTIEATANRPR